MLEGIKFLPGFLAPEEQLRLYTQVANVLAVAPYFQSVMPKTGQAMSVNMSNAGPLGWMADIHGYRYSPIHPGTGKEWPEIPEIAQNIWREVVGYPAPPECCLINYYPNGSAKMGMHQDRDEEAVDAPVLSISLGDTCVFRVGGFERKGPTSSIRLASGDVLVLGGASRLRFHGVDRVIAGSSRLVPGGGRINLTLRRVTKP